MNNNSSIKKEFNDINLKEIIKLKKIIAEKDTIILELHSKLREFRKDIDILKNKMIFISENTQTKEEVFNDNSLEIQKIQRFQILPNNIYQHNLNTIESISNKGNISINNLNQYFSDLENDLNEEINSNSFLKLKLIPYQTYQSNNNKKYNYTENNFYGNRNYKNKFNEVKNNTSLFFKKCKIIMSNEEYIELLRIIKLFNAKKISKFETYERITNYLDKINPELLKEFYNLFI